MSASETPMEGTVATTAHPDGRVDANIFAVAAKGEAKRAADADAPAEPARDEEGEK